MPDGGSYQLEDILDKELVFLNDFEYDEAAKKWMAWSFFKRFLEGGELTVARPKNRGGNAIFKSDAKEHVYRQGRCLVFHVDSDDNDNNKDNNN